MPPVRDVGGVHVNEEPLTASWKVLAWFWVVREMAFRRLLDLLATVLTFTSICLGPIKRLMVTGCRGSASVSLSCAGSIRELYRVVTTPCEHGRSTSSDTSVCIVGECNECLDVEGSEEHGGDG